MAKSLKDQIHTAIRTGRLDQACKLLIGYTQSLKDNHYYKIALQLSARYQSNEQTHLLGTLSEEDYTNEKSKLVKAILDLSEELDKAGLTGITSLKASILYTLTGLIVLLFLLEFWGVTRLFGVRLGADTMQLTVYVQDTQGKPIDELQNTGQLIVRFDNDLRDPLIGENGRTNLGEIPTKFQGQNIEIILVAEGYELVHPRKKYNLNGQEINLEVQRDNSLGLIQGIVKDRSGDNLIANALVIINQDTTTVTDSLGRFRIVLPPDKYQDTYALMIKKTGYEVKNEYYKPKAGIIELRLEEKQ